MRSATIRQRALLTFRALAPFDPDFLKRCLTTLPHRLVDQELQVKDATIRLIQTVYEVCEGSYNPDTN